MLLINNNLLSLLCFVKNFSFLSDMHSQISWAMLRCVLSGWCREIDIVTSLDLNSLYCAQIKVVAQKNVFWEAIRLSILSSFFPSPLYSITHPSVLIDFSLLIELYSSTKSLFDLLAALLSQ